MMDDSSHGFVLLEEGSLAFRRRPESIVCQCQCVASACVVCLEEMKVWYGEERQGGAGKCWESDLRGEKDQKIMDVSAETIERQSLTQPSVIPGAYLASLVSSC